MTVSRRDALRHVGKAVAAAAFIPFVVTKSKAAPPKPRRYTHAEQVARIMEIVNEVERDRELRGLPPL